MHSFERWDAFHSKAVLVANDLSNTILETPNEAGSYPLIPLHIALIEK